MWWGPVPFLGFILHMQLQSSSQWQRHLAITSWVLSKPKLNPIETTGDVNGFNHIPWRFVDWGLGILCYLWHPDTLSGLSDGKKWRKTKNHAHDSHGWQLRQRDQFHRVSGIVLDQVAYLPVMAEISLGVLNKRARLPLFQAPPQHLLGYISWGVLQWDNVRLG